MQRLESGEGRRERRKAGIRSRWWEGHNVTLLLLMTHSRQLSGPWRQPRPWKWTLCAQCGPFVMMCRANVSSHQRQTQQNIPRFCTTGMDGADLCSGSTSTRPQSLTQRCKRLFLQLSAANFNGPDGRFFSPCCVFSWIIVCHRRRQARP